MQEVVVVAAAAAVVVVVAAVLVLVLQACDVYRVSIGPLTHLPPHSKRSHVDGRTGQTTRTRHQVEQCFGIKHSEPYTPRRALNGIAERRIDTRRTPVFVRAAVRCPGARNERAPRGRGRSGAVEVSFGRSMVDIDGAKGC